MNSIDQEIFTDHEHRIRLLETSNTRIETKLDTIIDSLEKRKTNWTAIISIGLIIFGIITGAFAWQIAPLTQDVRENRENIQEVRSDLYDHVNETIYHIEPN